MKWGKYIIKFILLLLTVVGFSLAETIYHKDHLLNTGVGARSVALGHAFVAVDKDVSGLLYNPATVAFIPGFTVSAQKNRRLIDVEQTSIAAVMPTAYGVWSAGYLELGLPKIALAAPTLDTEDHTQLAGYAKYSERAYVLGYAMAISQTESFGLLVKSYQNDLSHGLKDMFDEYTASGSDIDLGYWRSINEKWQMGIAYHNIYGKLRWSTETEEKIMGQFRVGLLHHTTMWALPAAIVFDYELPQEGQGLMHSGAEIDLSDYVQFRAGLQQRIWAETIHIDPTLGLGLSLWGAQIDYAFDPEFGEANDTKHTITLAYQFDAGETLVVPADKPSTEVQEKQAIPQKEHNTQREKKVAPPQSPYIEDESPFTIEDDRY